MFYADRLIRLVVEKGLGLLPFSRNVVITPTGEPYFGVAFAQGIIGVSIIRGGEAMENSLRGEHDCFGCNVLFSCTMRSIDSTTYPDQNPCTPRCRHGDGKNGKQQQRFASRRESERC